MELTYRKVGDYYLPDLALEDEEEEMPLGRYGMLRQTFLQEKHHGTYTSMLLTGRLMPHLYEIDRQCRERVDRMVEELKRQNGVDEAMKEHFRPNYEEVRAFTVQPVARLAMELRTRDSYKGMCDYINLIHTVQISVPEAQLSFAAPLTYNGTVQPGEVIFNDMFTIYPYENQLYVLKLKGSEIKDYLEYSYDTWIQTPGAHVLKMVNAADPRSGATRWSFGGRSYNFDSAAGLVYTVDVTRPAGSRIAIKSLADGSAFRPDGWYNVAMTSYRASGGGDLLIKGAGIAQEELDGRVIARYPEVRDLIYQYFKENGTVSAGMVGNPAVIGSWRFVPEKKAAPMFEADMNLIF